MFQIITYNKEDFKDYDNNYKVCNLNEFESFDDYEITIIDISNEGIWYNDGKTASTINDISDFKSLKAEINNTKKCKIIIVLPQNCNYSYFHNGLYNKYNNKTKLKDMLTAFNSIVSDNLYYVQTIDILYSKSTTKINDLNYKADFNFDLDEFTSFESVFKSDNSQKITTTKCNNVIITSLNIFETKEHFDNFIDSVPFNLKEKKIPEWVNQIVFYNDEELKKEKSANNKSIEEIRKKNQDIDNKIEENNKFKRILFSSGNELVEIVMEMLDKMLDHDSSNFVDKKREDFLIKKENVTFIGEIKGVSSSISNQNVSQLDVHVQNYYDQINYSKENIKGLLIINYQRNKRLEERNEIHKEQIKLAIRNKSLIIETKTLLKLFENFLKKDISTESIIKLLTEKTGVLLEKDIK